MNFYEFFIDCGPVSIRVRTISDHITSTIFQHPVPCWAEACSLLWIQPWTSFMLFMARLFGMPSLLLRMKLAGKSHHDFLILLVLTCIILLIENHHYYCRWSFTEVAERKVTLGLVISDMSCHLMKFSCLEDFNIDLAGSSTGTLYGRGAYLGESITKAGLCHNPSWHLSSQGQKVALLSLQRSCCTSDP